MTLHEIRNASGLGSAAQRYVYTLATLGYITKDDTRKEYTISPKMLEWVATYYQSSYIYEIAVNNILALGNAINENVHLVVRDGIDIVYVYRSHKHEVRFLNTFVGTRDPMYCTSSGRAILAFCSREDQDDVLSNSDLRKVTSTTKVLRQELRSELAEARKSGYAIVDRELGEGELAIAAPVFDRTGAAYAAITVPLSTTSWTAEEARRLIAGPLMRTAQATSFARGGAYPRDIIVPSEQNQKALSATSR